MQWIWTFVLFSFSVFAQVTGDHRQVVIVLTEGWEKSTARIYRFSRQDDASWKQTNLDPIPAVVGRSGLGWGIGVHPEGDASKKSPQKIEGDGKAPAGIFKVGVAFGYDELNPGITLDRRRLTPSFECVDDPESDYYNKIVDKKDVAEADWKSSEVMRRKDESYRYGLVIGHNPVPAQKGKGSCIFLHVWDGPQSATAGCTATHEHHVRSTIEWLNPLKNPLWIQLPWNEYLRLKSSWNLPEIDKKAWPATL